MSRATLHRGLLRFETAKHHRGLLPDEEDHVSLSDKLPTKRSRLAKRLFALDSGGRGWLRYTSALQPCLSPAVCIPKVLLDWFCRVKFLSGMARVTSNTKTVAMFVPRLDVEMVRVGDPWHPHEWRA